MAIKSVTNFKFGKKGNSFHVGYGVDESFLFGAGVSIASICLDNSNIDFHIFTDYVSVFERDRLRRLAQQYSINVSIYELDEHEVHKLPTTQCWSYAMYYRLLLLDNVNVDKILYLDADVICCAPLDELRDLAFDDNTIVHAVHDIYAQKASTIDVQGYFNSGVLYVDVHKYKSFGVTQKVIDILKREGTHFNYPDQDALNLVLNKHVNLIDSKFNTFFPIDAFLRKKTQERFQITEDTVFIHYVGVTKPWHDWAKGYVEVKPFHISKLNSPWRATDYVKPKTYKLMARKSRHLRYQGKIIQSLFYYIMYIVMKIQRK